MLIMLLMLMPESEEDRRLSREIEDMRESETEDVAEAEDDAADEEKVEEGEGDEEEEAAPVMSLWASAPLLPSPSSSLGEGPLTPRPQVFFGWPLRPCTNMMLSTSLGRGQKGGKKGESREGNNGSIVLDPFRCWTTTAAVLLGREQGEPGSPDIYHGDFKSRMCIIRLVITYSTSCTTKLASTE